MSILMVSPEEKITMERVMRSLLERFAALYGKDVAFTEAYRNGDESVYDALVAQACAEHGVAVEDYVADVEADEQLSELLKRSIKDILLGPVERARDSSRRAMPETD